MNPRLKVKTAPAEEPVTTAEAKLHLRETGTTQDAPIGEMITTAREVFEELTASTVILTTYEWTLDAFPLVLLPPRATPLVSVTSIKYTDSEGNQSTVAASDYIADTQNRIGSIRPVYGGAWPSFTAYPVNPVIVEYKAGAASASVVTKSIKNWILAMVGVLYEQREMAFVGGNFEKEVDLRRYFGSILAKHTAKWAF